MGNTARLAYPVQMGRVIAMLCAFECVECALSCGWAWVWLHAVAARSCRGAGLAVGAATGTPRGGALCAHALAHAYKLSARGLRGAVGASLTQRVSSSDSSAGGHQMGGT